MSAHTPGPWGVAPAPFDDGVTAGDFGVCMCGTEEQESGELDRANAAFIVRACNAHYKLLDALNQCVRVFDGLRNGRAISKYDRERTENEARAAIAKAEGK